MKKIASILIIITSSISLLLTLSTLGSLFWEIGEYGFDYYYINRLFSPIADIAFIILGIALLNDGNSSSISHSSPKASNSKTPNNQSDLDPNDMPSTGLNIISFLIPLVGLIIYLTEKDRSPKKASSAGKAALWGVGVSFVLTIISIIISVSIASSMF